MKIYADDLKTGDIILTGSGFTPETIQVRAVARHGETVVAETTRRRMFFHIDDFVTVERKQEKP